MVGVSNGMLPVEYFGYAMLLFASIKFNGDHKIAYKDHVRSVHPHVMGILPDLK